MGKATLTLFLAFRDGFVSLLNSLQSLTGSKDAELFVYVGDLRTSYVCFIERELYKQHTQSIFSLTSSMLKKALKVCSA